MADRVKDISKASDSELNDLISRLRKEGEVLYLISELSRRAGGKTADKSKSIKDSTDEELDALLIRLRKESEAQYLIGDLKRKSGEVVSYDNPQVSTEAPVENLYHYGILGMKWGRRKSSGSSTTTVIRSRNSEDHDKRMSLKGRKLSELTNDELQIYAKRMALEKQYKELAKADISFGRKLANSIIEKTTKSATDAVVNYVNKQAVKMVEEMIKKASSTNTAEDILKKAAQTTSKAIT